MRRLGCLGIAIATLSCGGSQEGRPTLPSAEATASAARVVPPGSAPRELVWVSKPEPCAVVGHAPVWWVSVQPLAKGAKSSSQLALGRLGEDGKSLALTRLFPFDGRALAWPGHPMVAALQTADGLDLVEGENTRTIPEAGAWSFSENGDLAAVASRNPPHLSIYETRGWTKRTALTAGAAGSGSFRGKHYFEVDDGHALVVDIDASKVLVDRDGYAALSPDDKTVGVLSSTDIGWAVDVYDLSQPEKPKRIDLGALLFNGLPFVELTAERRLIIRQRMAVGNGDFEQSDVASIDVASGRVARSRPVAPPLDDRPFLNTQAVAQRRALLGAVGSLVPNPRAIVAVDGDTSSYAWSRASGQLAAVVGEPDGCSSSMTCRLGGPSMLFADTKTRRSIAEVQLPVRWLHVRGVGHLTDERMAIVCGSDSERSLAYVVDATRGRFASIPEVDCARLVTDKERTTLLAGGTWVDLTRRPEGEWPRVIALSAAPPPAGSTLKAPADSVGLYCRIDDRLAPAADCPPR